MANPAKTRTKHQVKTEATRIALVEAAEMIFARDGYERAQIDEIAKQSGRTRGAVYANYKTKESLFFAVQERRIQLAAEKMLKAIARHPHDPAQSLRDLKNVYAELDDTDGDILDLELKLYAVRNPDCREAWRERYASLYTQGRDFEFAATFGVADERGRSQVYNRMLGLAAIKSGLVLAMRFMPQELSPKQTALVLKEVFDGLFPTVRDVNTSPASGGKAAKPKRTRPSVKAAKPASK